MQFCSQNFLSSTALTSDNRRAIVSVFPVTPTEERRPRRFDSGILESPVDDTTASPSPDPILRWVDPNGNEIKRGPYSEIGPEYAAARAAGATGTLIPLAPAAPAAPAAAPVVSSGFGVGDTIVDPTKAAQIAKDIREISALGFVPPATLFAPGTRMIQIGVDNYRHKYYEWSGRPLAEDVLRATAQKIREEDRRSLVIRLGDLRMLETGEIGRKNGPARPIEFRAWEQVYNALKAVGVFPDGTRLLAALDAPLRARIFNGRIEKIDPDKEVKIGVRRSASGGWSIFRVVGPRFPDEASGDVAADTAADAIEGFGFRGSVVYNPNTTDLSFDAASMADPTSLDPVVGDIFRAGIKGSTNDAGGGSFKVSPFAGRIVCVNCTVIDAYAPGVHRAHRGDMSAAVDGIRDAAILASKVVPLFAKDWKILRNTRINKFPWVKAAGRIDTETRAILRDPKLTVPDIIRAMVDGGEISATMGRDALVQALLTGYGKEPGETVADVLNAVTRAAHESIVDGAVRDTLERRAGALVPVFARYATERAPEAR